jgi:hypothetical protein
MEPPEVLAIHTVPHANPKVRRVGFALDDPYVEQVWAGVIDPSALLVLRRLPVLWRGREPAVVDMHELGQSLGLGPSLACSGRPWKTIGRLVGFGMAHWLPGDEFGVRTEVAPLSSRHLARVPKWTRRVHDRLLGTHLDRLALANTDRTLDTARITARLDHLQLRRPTITRGLGLQPWPSPRCSDTARLSSPALYRRPEPTDPARTPLQVPLRGTCGRPPSVTRVMHPWSMPPGWTPPAEAGRAILRVAIAVRTERISLEGKVVEMTTACPAAEEPDPGGSTRRNSNSSLRPTGRQPLPGAPRCGRHTAESFACVKALAARTSIPHRPARISKPFAGRHSLPRDRPVTSPNTPSVVSGVGGGGHTPFSPPRVCFQAWLAQNTTNPTHSVSLSEVGVVVSEGGHIHYGHGRSPGQR